MSVKSKMTAIADEVRTLSGTTEAMGLDAMASTLNTENTNFETNLTTQDDLIAQIQTALEGKAGRSSEPVLQDKTVTPTTSTQTVTADSGYDGLDTVTVNAMPTATQATPSISVNSSGLITASATQSAGYVAAGTKSATKQLTTQAAQTITPTTTDQTIVSGKYLTGTQTIKGDANLVAGNIKSGVSIFGVSGSYEGGGSSSSGGGSVEACTITITPDMMISPVSPTYYYTDAETMTIKSLATQDAIITVPKNSIIAILDWSSYSGASGLCSLIFYESMKAAYQITGDCTFVYSA